MGEKEKGKKIIIYDEGNIVRISEYVEYGKKKLVLEAWGNATGRVRVNIGNEDYNKTLIFFKSLSALKEEDLK